MQLLFCNPLVAPYRPAGQSTGAADPATQKHPRGQLAVHGAGLAKLPSKVPAAHKSQTAAPDRLNRPAGHIDAVGVKDPGGHEYPAAQLPKHAAVTKPTTAPKVPAGHAAVHELLVRPAVAPKVPAGQGVHDPDPAKLYCPGEHSSAVALVLPAGQAYPGLHARQGGRPVEFP